MTPVWVQVWLAGMRWGTACGIATGSVIAAFTMTLDGWAPPGATAWVAFIVVLGFYGAVVGAACGFGTGLAIGLIAGLILQLMLRRAQPSRAVLATVAIVSGLQIVLIIVWSQCEPAMATLLLVPAMAAVPLQRAANRVAMTSAVDAQRHDTFAG